MIVATLSQLIAIFKVREKAMFLPTPLPVVLGRSIGLTARAWYMKLSPEALLIQIG